MLQVARQCQYCWKSVECAAPHCHSCGAFRAIAVLGPGPLALGKFVFRKSYGIEPREIREAQADFNYVGSDREGDQSVYLVGSGSYEAVLLKDNQATIRSIEGGKSPFVTATRLNEAPQVISQQAWKLQNPLSLQGLSGHHDKTGDGHPRDGRLAEGIWEEACGKLGASRHPPNALTAKQWAPQGLTAGTAREVGEDRSLGTGNVCHTMGQWNALWLVHLQVWDEVASKLGVAHMAAAKSWCMGSGVRPCKNMLAQEVLEPDYGSQVSFGGKVVVVDLTLEQSELAFWHGFGGLTMKCRADGNPSPTRCRFTLEAGCTTWSTGDTCGKTALESRKSFGGEGGIQVQVPSHLHRLGWSGGPAERHVGATPARLEMYHAGTKPHTGPCTARNQWGQSSRHFQGKKVRAQEHNAKVKWLQHAPAQAWCEQPWGTVSRKDTACQILLQWRAVGASFGKHCTPGRTGTPGPFCPEGKAALAAIAPWDSQLLSRPGSSTREFFTTFNFFSKTTCS